nr:MAG TPA: hypothetical protein [Caudoviricetes sp.]
MNKLISKIISPTNIKSNTLIFLTSLPFCWLVNF